MRELPKSLYNKFGELSANCTRLSWIEKHEPELLSDILENTKHLSDISFKERFFLYVKGLNHIPLCKNLSCQKQLIYKGTITKGYGTYCSGKCCNTDENDIKNRVNTYQQTIEEKYGAGIKNFFQTSEFKENTKKSNIEKYGVEFGSQREDIITKISKTIDGKYGGRIELGKLNMKNIVKVLQKKHDDISITNIMSVKEYRDKIKTTNLQRYGAETTLEKGTSVRKRIEKTNLLKFGSISPFGSKSIKIKSQLTIFGKIKDRINTNLLYNIPDNEFLEKGIFGVYNFTCKNCGNTFQDTLMNNTYKTITCYKCKPRNVSQYEKVLFNEIKSIDPKLIVCMNDKKILGGKELDLYIPEKRLAIEFDGLAFHSYGKSKHSMFNNSELESFGKFKHLDKTNLCKAKGIKLLHIFSNEWHNPIKRKIWMSIIQNNLGKSHRLFARKCYIKEIPTSISSLFLNDNHLQGNAGASIKLGLFNSSHEIVSVMTFGVNRFQSNNSWEMIRFANKAGYSIVGGASKLLRFFNLNYNQDKRNIISYADRRFSDGTLYEKLGFQLKHASQPNYFYFLKRDDLLLESRLKYQKHKLKTTLSIFDENLTEGENMFNNGYRRVWDCGSFVYNYIP